MSGIFSTIEQEFHLTTTIFTPLSLQYFFDFTGFYLTERYLKSACHLQAQALRFSECVRVDQKFCFRTPFIVEFYEIGIR